MYTFRCNFLLVLWQDMTFRKDLMANFMGGPGYFKSKPLNKIFGLKRPMKS